MLTRLRKDTEAFHLHSDDNWSPVAIYHSLREYLLVWYMNSDCWCLPHCPEVLIGTHWILFAFFSFCYLVLLYVIDMLFLVIFCFSLVSRWARFKLLFSIQIYSSKTLYLLNLNRGLLLAAEILDVFCFQLSPKKGIDIYYYFDELNNKLYVNNF